MPLAAKNDLRLRQPTSHSLAAPPTEGHGSRVRSLQLFLVEASAHSVQRIAASESESERAITLQVLAYILPIAYRRLSLT